MFLTLAKAVLFIFEITRRGKAARQAEFSNVETERKPCRSIHSPGLTAAFSEMAIEYLSWQGR
jgi:hypothetical protein